MTPGRCAPPAASSSEPGTYTLRIFADDGIRVWVEDQLLINDWNPVGTAWRQATLTNTIAGAAKRIRIEYFEATVTAQLELHWTTPGGLQQAVPGSQLRPRYGLTTSTVTSESDGVTDLVNTPPATPTTASTQCSAWPRPPWPDPAA